MYQTNYRSLDFSSSFFFFDHGAATIEDELREHLRKKCFIRCNEFYKNSSALWIQEVCFLAQNNYMEGSGSATIK